MAPGYGSRGEAGVGSSIVFIAMILTSSAAGSLVVNSVGLAGAQAETVFDDSLDRVCRHVEVKSIIGTCDQYGLQMTGMEILVALGAGSGALDLKSIVIEVLVGSGHYILAYGSGYTATKVLDGGGGNGSVLARGDMCLLTFALPGGAAPNQNVEVAIIPTDGFEAWFSFIVPDPISSEAISIG